MQRSESIQEVAKADEEQPLLGGKDGVDESPLTANPPYGTPLLGDHSPPPFTSHTEQLSSTQLIIILGSTYLGIILAALDGTMWRPSRPQSPHRTIPFSCSRGWPRRTILLIQCCNRCQAS